MVRFELLASIGGQGFREGGRSIMLRREGFLSVKEAAELLDVAPNTVRAWGAAGKITEYRHPVNNYRMYKRRELEKIVEKAKRPVTGSRGARSGR